MTLDPILYLQVCLVRLCDTDKRLKEHISVMLPRWARRTEGPGWKGRVIFEANRKQDRYSITFWLALSSLPSKDCKNHSLLAVNSPKLNNRVFLMQQCWHQEGSQQTPVRSENWVNFGETDLLESREQRAERRAAHTRAVGALPAGKGREGAPGLSLGWSVTPRDQKLLEVMVQEPGHCF